MNSVHMSPGLSMFLAARQKLPGRAELHHGQSRREAPQVRSGQVYYSRSAEVSDHESHKAAYATSEHRLLKSIYARIVP
jgi:hypothetical protein